jgi:RNA polymerase sigma-70 factor (ECF subfamily)
VPRSLIVAMTTGFRLLPDEEPAATPVDQQLRGQIARHAPDLHRRALSLTRTAHDAADLVQDTVERALRHADRFAEGTNLLLWLITIMKNLFLDRCRSARARSKVVQLVPDPDTFGAQAVPDETDEIPSWARISADQFHAAVAQLDPALREVFRLRVALRLPYARIADELGIPLSTVGTRLNRSRLHLKRILSGALDAERPEGRPFLELDLDHDHEDEDHEKAKDGTR